MPRNRSETKPFAFLAKGACEECGYLGWWPMDYDTSRESIQRCDTCSVFKTEHAAEKRARMCIKQPFGFWPPELVTTLSMALDVIYTKDRNAAQSK